MVLSAVYTEAGDPADVVKLIDTNELRDPGPGQVLIRVTLFPIHWGDLQAIQLASPTGRVGAGVEATGWRRNAIIRNAGIPWILIAASTPQFLYSVLTGVSMRFGIVYKQEGTYQS